MLNNDKTINKGTIDLYLKDLSKEIKKEFGRNVRLELVIVGGASIIINYGFRDSTLDIDAYVSTGSSIEGAVRRVADKYGLSDEWLNSNFKKTLSYSPKLTQYSRYYRTFNQVLTVRTIDAENLIAMKLVSYRPYKYDRSDIVGILDSCAELGISMDLDKIKNAVVQIYGDWDHISIEAQNFIEEVLKNKRSYEDISNEEVSNKILLQDFDSKYKNVLNRDNLENILSALKKKKED